MQPFSGRYRGLLIEWCEQWRQGGCNGAYFYRSDGGDFDPSLIQGIRDGRIIYDGSANDALFGPFAAIDSAVADINAFMTETEPKHTSEAIPLMLDALKTVVDLGAAGLFGIAGALERLESEKAKLLETLEALIGCRELNKFFDTRKYGVHYICRFCRTRYVEPMVICVNRDCPANKARAAIAEAERP